MLSKAQPNLKIKDLVAERDIVIKGTKPRRPDCKRARSPAISPSSQKNPQKTRSWYYNYRADHADKLPTGFISFAKKPPPPSEHGKSNKNFMMDVRQNDSHLPGDSNVTREVSSCAKRRSHLAALNPVSAVRRRRAMFLLSQVA